VKPRWIIPALACGLAVAFQAPALGQQTGSILLPPAGAVRAPDGNSSGEARRLVRSFAACFARAQATVSQALVRAPFGGDEQIRGTTRALESEQRCLDDPTIRVSLDGRRFVGYLSEYFLTGQLAQDDLTGLVNLPNEQLQPLNLMPRNPTEDFALCVVRRDPQGVRTFVSTNPATDEERGAARALMTHLQGCLPAGSTISLTTGELRGYLAPSLYRALMAMREHKAR
jgi:hypothetical protein